jgi:hypothetical protein
MLNVCPHEEQNPLSGKFCAEHFGHCTIDGGVIGIQKRHRLYAITCGKESMFDG